MWSIYVYIPPQVMLPSAATLMQFCKFYFFVTINVTHIVTQRDMILNVYITFTCGIIS